MVGSSVGLAPGESMVGSSVGLAPGESMVGSFVEVTHIYYSPNEEGNFQGNQFFLLQVIR